MAGSNRRQFLRTSTAVTTTAALSSVPRSLRAAGGKDLHLAPFRFDVTPPMGHSLCGGWITPVQAIDDPLEAIGIVLLGAGEPIVLCTVDWTGLMNEAHLQWRQVLAEAAGTRPERVAVHCVHQHNAPFACLDAESLVSRHDRLPSIVDTDFYRRCLDRGRQAVSNALSRARRVTHVAHAQAEVHQIASNRRVDRDAQGNIQRMRGSSCRDERLRELPEGLIDPQLKAVAFYDGPEKVAVCHYYATHPMSYYGDGRVSSDFAGLARKQRQQDEPQCHHLYFTGCAGNVAAGKYNDGSHAVRLQLTQRLYDAMVRAERQLQPQPVETIGWRATSILPPPRQTLQAETLQSTIDNPDLPVVERNRTAFMLSWLRRLERKLAIDLTCLEVNDIHLLHLPAECFVQYQLRAQRLRPDRFVATAAYGDGGPWYIPVQDEYAYGGYEVSVAFCDPAIDPILTRGMETLLS